jgi:hypothetical protein
MPPVSVGRLAGLAQANPDVRSVTLDAANPFDGDDNEIAISNEIESVSARCFSWCDSIWSVRFESGAVKFR